jgi:hypothetical protein
MMRGVRVWLVAAAVLTLAPALAHAQEGQIAGTVRDASSAVMPGVTVEVTSPALIEKVRTATTDAAGQYRITNLPVGIYTVSFALEGFSKQQREGVALTTGFTAQVNATMTVGQLAETLVVSGSAPIVDVQNAREVISLTGAEVKELPTSRNVNSLLELTPGINSMYKPTSTFGAPGVCVGGVGVFCNPGVSAFNVGDNDTTNLSQGRVMVDGQVVNSALGTAQPIGGQTGGYTADIANAAEVNIQVSGALGDSETGGASINIIPRTGGNRYTGDFNATYTQKSWFDANNGNYPTLSALAVQQMISDHDVSASFGGPIKRDKLWFYAIARDQRIHKIPVGADFWPNLWEGKWGYNYQPDRDKPRVDYKNQWINGNARVTWQATPKNKFGFFWDEQDFCQDPCHGVVSVFTSPESWWSVSIKPDRLQQVTWTNPLTSKVLLEGALSYNKQFYSTASSRDYTNPQDIPRIVETGDTAGADSVAPRVNPFAGGAGLFALTSGALNSQLGGGGAETRDVDSYRMRGSLSYVTGQHHVKLGYDGAFYKQLQTNKSNVPQMTFNYLWPAANCADTLSCGNTSLQFPADPNNLARRPIPSTVDINTGTGTLDDHVNYTALYAQDQWTIRRLTLGGALRFDHATSGYGSTCIGPNVFVAKGYCTDPVDGVNYKDLTPRFAATWDITGDGKTALKWNMGKFLNAAGINGTYSGANPARRTVNILRRAWNDVDGDRHPDCDLLAVAPNGECGAFSAGLGITTNTAAFGQDPNALDAAGTPIGLTTTQCGRTESAIPAAIQSYCNKYGESVVDGWGRRRSEWQFGLGVQREVLPRLSAELMYNRRSYSNILVSDTLNVGCDKFNGAVDYQTCQAAMLRYSNPSFDFYRFTAPKDPRLPNGGGYTILGLSTDRPTQATNQPIAQIYDDTLNYYWHGFDTNFNWRGPLNIRAQGGTSTGRSQRNTCESELDPVTGTSPNVRGREGAEWQAGCDTRTPWQTSFKGSASYTIPKIDLLVSTVWQSLPGVDISASMTVSKDQVTWEPDSAARASLPCFPATAGTGCFGRAANLTTQTVQLLLNNEVYGERVTTMDLKLLKNFRFAEKRAAIGVDIYNFLNSDAVTSYNTTYTPDNPATPANENQWLQPMGLVTPRFVRLQVQFTF